MIQTHKIAKMKQNGDRTLIICLSWTSLNQLWNEVRCNPHRVGFNILKSGVFSASSKKTKNLRGGFWRAAKQAFGTETPRRFEVFWEDARKKPGYMSDRELFADCDVKCWLNLFAAGKFLPLFVGPTESQYGTPIRDICGCPHIAYLKYRGQGVLQWW